jgi:hypothetical protein
VVRQQHYKNRKGYERKQNKPSCTGELHATWLVDAKQGKKPEEEVEKRREGEREAKSER